jgi:hypothetical protein
MLIGWTGSARRFPRSLGRLSLAGWALFGLAPLTAGCASMDDQPEAQVAYAACTSAYNTKRQGLTGAWAFVSGVNGQQSSCFWSWDGATAADASASAQASCQKSFSGCYEYATSDGWSTWVKQISDNGGRVVAAVQPAAQSNISTRCKLGLFTAGVQTAVDIVAALKGDSVPYDGSQIDPSLCQN